ncbi:hypothetical protein GPALN_004914 [Globodera pallida]|nr:hypothetical protein GPALN_004914 [Globodera pallida]
MNDHFLSATSDMAMCRARMVIDAICNSSYVKTIDNRDDIIEHVQQQTELLFEAFAEMLNLTSWATAETKRKNLPDFGRDFNCPIGSPMRPLEKEQCKMWT